MPGIHQTAAAAGRLADLFIAPASATQLGAIAARGAESPMPALFARSALQAPRADEDTRGADQ